MPDAPMPLVGGIDLGGTKILSVAVGPDGRVLGEDLRPTEAAGGPDHVLGRMRDSLLAAVRAAGPQPELAALGVAAPGPIDFERGVVVEVPNLPGWENLPVAARLSELLGCPAILENDANAAALGEFTAGAGKGTRNLVYLTVSTGIGGGLVLDGRLYRGSDGAAGELGHIPLVAGGPRCGCGAQGCLEALASGPAIARDAAELVAAGRAPILAELAAGRSVTAEMVHEAAQRGEAGARTVIEQAGRHLGAGLVAFTNIFNPDIIVIGGGAAKIGALLLDPALGHLYSAAMRPARDRVRVIPAALGDRAGALGVVALARERVGWA